MWNLDDRSISIYSEHSEALFLARVYIDLDLTSPCPNIKWLCTGLLSTPTGWTHESPLKCPHVHPKVSTPPLSAGGERLGSLRATSYLLPAGLCTATDGLPSYRTSSRCYQACRPMHRSGPAGSFFSCRKKLNFLLQFFLQFV